MKRILLISLSILFISCSNVSLETESVYVRSIEDGEILHEGDTFTISLDKSSDSVVVHPTSALVTITYKNTNSDIVVEPIEREIDYSTNPTPEFKINDFEEGVYSLHVIVYEDESVISEYVSEFIVYSGELSAEVLSLQPEGDLYTNSKIILESLVIYDTYIDPFLVWTHKGEVIQEGFLSDGYDSIIFDTADYFGFVDVKLEFFPYRLEAIGLESENSLDFSFVVNPLSNNLYSYEELSSYYKALYFNGNYIDELNKDLEIHNFGETTPTSFSNFYGMEIGAYAGFSTYDSIIPVNQETFDLMSFSIEMQLLPKNIEDGSILSNFHRGLSFDLFVEDSVLKYSYGSLVTESIITNVEGLKTDEAISLVISFIRNEIGYEVLFYKDSILVNRTSWFFTNDQLTSVDEFQDLFSVGGSLDALGFSTILESIKIYYLNNSGENDIISDNFAKYINDDAHVILANGFNSIIQPKNIVGDALLDGEYIRLPLDSIVNYLDILPSSEGYTLVVDSISGSYKIVFYSLEGPVLEKILYNDIEIKKRADTIFIGTEMFPDWSSGVTGFSIEPIDGELVLDSILVLGRDLVIEAE